MTIDQGPSSPYGTCMTIWQMALSYSSGSKTPSGQVEETVATKQTHGDPRLAGTSRLMIWGSWNTTLCPHHQLIRRKACILSPSPQIQSFKMLSCKPSGSLSLLSLSCPYSLLGACNKHCTFFSFFVYFDVDLSLLFDVLFFWLWGTRDLAPLGPWAGTEPVSPTMEGNVLTTGPPGKGQCCSFLHHNPASGNWLCCMAGEQTPSLVL